MNFLDNSYQREAADVAARVRVSLPISFYGALS